MLEPQLRERFFEFCVHSERIVGRPSGVQLKGLLSLSLLLRPLECLGDNLAMRSPSRFLFASNSAPFSADSVPLR